MVVKTVASVRLLALPHTGNIILDKLLTLPILS